MRRVVLDANALIAGSSTIGPDQESSISSVTYAELEAGSRLPSSGAGRATRVRKLALIKDTYSIGLPFGGEQPTS